MGQGLMENENGNREYVVIWRGKLVYVKNTPPPDSPYDTKNLDIVLL